VMSRITPLFVVGCIASTPAIAEPIQLADYLSSMDRTEVHFSGKIGYSSSDNVFTFFDENRGSFGVTVDAGRDTREKIERECGNTSFLISHSDLCIISGVGTVEIRGSRIYLSIEQVYQISR